MEIQTTSSCCIDSFILSNEEINILFQAKNKTATFNRIRDWNDWLNLVRFSFIKEDEEDENQYVLDWRGENFFESNGYLNKTTSNKNIYGNVDKI